jgi:hypothetical protein
MRQANGTLTVGVDECYVVEQQGESLRLGQQVASEVLVRRGGATVRTERRPPQAWDSRDAGSCALLVAVDGVASAERNRGG